MFYQKSRSWGFQKNTKYSKTDKYIIKTGDNTTAERRHVSSLTLSSGFALIPVAFLASQEEDLTSSLSVSAGWSLWWALVPSCCQQEGASQQQLKSTCNVSVLLSQNKAQEAQLKF